MICLKFSLPFALASSYWLISTRYSFSSSVNKRGTNFALKRRILSFMAKFDGKILCWCPLRQQTSRTVKRRFPRITALAMVVVCWCGRSSRPGIFIDRYSALFKTLKTFIALRSAHAVLTVCLIKQLKSVFHIHTLFFKLFRCHLVANPTKNLCTCSVQRM